MNYLYLILLATSVFAGLQGDEPFIQLWCAGPLHKSEIVGETGQTWFALYDEPEGFHLKATRVVVLDSATSGGIMEKFVRVDENCPSIFLLRGLPSLREGVVNTFYRGALYLKPSHRLNLAMSDSNYYTIQASGEKDEEVIDSYKLTIYHDQKSQVILSIDKAYLESAPTIVWAGDLDRDGKLDILIDSYSYNGNHYILYLSSVAKPGEIVSRVARFSRTGC